MSLGVEHLSYPLLALQPVQGLAEVHLSPEELRLANTAGLEGGYFEGLTLIEGNGQSYVVRSARNAGPAGSFWGFSLWSSREIHVDLEIEPSKKLSLDDVKQKLAEVIEAGEELWEAICGIEDLKKQLTSSRSIREIINILNR